MRTPLIFFILILALKGFCQPHFYEFNPAVPPKYAVNTDSMYKALLKENMDLKEPLRKDYAEGLTFYHRDMVNSGQIYFNCTEIESYLNLLLKKIVDVNHSAKKFSIYIVRDEDVNASALDNGIVYINIGLLAKIKDEAALVSVIAHEVSHALNSDSKKLVVLNEKHTGKGKTVKDLLRMSHGSREFEARADSAGFRDAISLGYNISSSYNTFIGFESESRWYKSQYSYQDPKWYIALDDADKGTNVAADSLGKFLLDHPDNYSRIALLNKFIAKENGKQSYIESESAFNKIKKLARLEQLYLDLEEGNYKDCLRNAFYYHLFDQKDATFLYYISESLRRIILNEPRIKRRGFLTENSKEKIFETDKGILHDISFISLDTSLKRILQRDSVYGYYKKPFETYIQAANYFIKKSIEASSPGINLTSALFEFNKNKKEKGIAQLQLHLAQTSPELKEFSEALSKGTLEEEVEYNNTNLVYIKPVEFYSSKQGRLKYSYTESHKMSAKLYPIITKEYTESDPKNKIVITDSMNISEYQFLDDMVSKLKAFKNPDEAENENRQNKVQDPEYWKSKEMQDPMDADVLIRKKNFFHLEPKSWKWFKDQKVKSVTVLRPYFYEHPLLGLFFYLDIAYYDPINRKYVYYDQKYVEKYLDVNVRRAIKRFERKIAGKEID